MKVQYADIAQGIEATLAVLRGLPQVGAMRRHVLDLSNSSMWGAIAINTKL